MIWLTGIVAIALMLAILELDPNQLYMLSHSVYQVNSERWQDVSYYLLGAIVLFRLGSYLSSFLVSFLVSFLNKLKLRKFYRFSCSQAANTQAANTQANTKINPLYLTPYKNLKQFGLFKLFTKIITLLIFLLAVLCNSVAQRLAMIEASPQKPTYIQALVTPIGLSDKRLEIEDGVVVQGYRQLVQLTDIRYDSLQPNIDNSKESGGNDGNVSDKQPFNPFTTNDNPKSKSKQKTALNNITQSLNYASINTSQLPATMTVMLQSYQIKDLILNDLAPHQHLNMKLSLLPLELKNNDNPDEFDEYRWLSSRHATAKAFVVSMDDKNESVRAKPAHSKIIPTDSKTIPAYTKTNLTLQQQIDVMRYQFREHFIGLMRARSNKDIVTHQVDTPIVKKYKDNDLKIYDSRSSYIKNSEGIVNSNQTNLNQDEVAVTLSLLTGDRSLISDDMTALYRFGGISHLLAISGTHVLFLSLLCASMATAFINYFWPSLYYILPRWQCAFIIAAITAFGYALFAGFDVPAFRTACMLLLAGVMRYILAVPAIFKMLLVLGVGMAWADVFVLWQAGFWLSFVAVAVLVAFSQRWDRRDSQNHNLTLPAKLKQQFVALFKLQLWMSVALLPISLWLFSKVSLWGFIVNLFAIGLFGWVIVPLNLLASVLFTIIPDNQLSNAIWSLLFWILDHLHSVLQGLQNTFQQSGWLYSAINLPLLCLFMLMALPWVLPKFMLSRSLSVIPLLIIGAVSIASNTTNKDNNPLHITVLDPKDFNYSATLIQNEQQAWLLLSDYNKRYKKTSDKLIVKRQQQLSQNLYDQLKHHNIGYLTGIIVQTGKSDLEGVVAKLNQFMPISYYWQAGLKDNLSSDNHFNNNSSNNHTSNNYPSHSNEILADSSLQPQSCDSGKQWPKPPNDQHNIDARSLNGLSLNLNDLSLKVLTGWVNVDDSRVWDCVVEISTTKAVYLNEQRATEQLFPDKSTIDSLSFKQDVNQMNEKSHNKVLNIADKNSVVFYSSAEPQLSKLWQLMCDSDNPIIGANSIHNTQKFESKLSKSYWLTSSQSKLDESITNGFSINHWKIIGEANATANLPLKEVYAKWQDQ